MTKDDLQKLINQSSQAALSELADRIPEELKSYADSHGKISNESLASFCMITSHKLANQMLFEVLSKALEIEE